MKLFWPINMEFDKAIERLKTSPTSSPFNEEALSFTHALSKKLIQVRNIPEVVALGYWLRKSNIKELKRVWEVENEKKIVKARGTVFHIAPANVDTLFVYSWMLSLLMGNRNIIRLSSKITKNELISVILDELSNPKFQNVADRTIICTYGHEENVTKKISLICHSRVIWGGDKTVQNIRKIPLSPLANELAFADRFSLAALSAKQVNQLSEGELLKLLEKFYNDVFWFDQMACSSPRLIIWIGSEMEIKKAKEVYWRNFEKVIEKKSYELEAAVQVLKYTTSLWVAASEGVNEVINVPYFSRVSTFKLPIDARERHCGGGLFYEMNFETIHHLVKIISDKDQTLSYFGFSYDELVSFVNKIETRGIDRIVPFGEALNFDGTWDGQSFLKSFTRDVIIK